MLYTVMVPGKTRSIAMGYVSWDGVRCGARLGHPGGQVQLQALGERSVHQAESAETGHGVLCQMASQEWMSGSDAKSLGPQQEG